MALLEDEPTLSTRRVLLAGIPSFVAAVTVSLLTHQMAHRLGGAAFCGGASPVVSPVLSLMTPETAAGDCGMSALVSQAWTFGLAIVSFALFLRSPNNLFLMSMAFVNATARLPEAVTVFLQYLLHSRTALRVDESISLSLLGLADPTIPTVIMCFYSLLLLFFSIIVVHDVKAVRYKWAIAFVLFATAGFIEAGVIWILGPALQA
jgi:hypothetical protein